jgi:hypothetical protein
MPDMSEIRGQSKYNPWSYMLEFGSEAYDTTPEKYIVTKPWRRPRPTQGKEGK